jgi:hypothetical protein
MAEDFFAGAPDEPKKEEEDLFAEAPPSPELQAAAPPIRFVPQGVPREEPRPPPPSPGFLDAAEAAAAGAARQIAGGFETVDALQRRLRGLPPREHPDPVPVPPVEEIKPSEALASPIEKGVPWAGYMIGRGVPAAAGAIATGGGALGMMAGAGLAQFITDYGPRFRENLEAGMQEDEALRAALKSSGVSAGATAAAFGVPLTILKQVLLQPTIAAAETVFQNYLAGKTAFEDVGEAGIAGLVGAAPVVAAKGVGRWRRGRGAPEAEPRPTAEAPPAEPRAEALPEAPPAKPPAEEVLPPAKPAAAAPPAEPAPALPRAEVVEPDLFSQMLGIRPAAAAAAPRPRIEPPRAAPRVEPPVEPPRAPEAPPERVPPRERVPEIPPEEEAAPPPPAEGRVYEPELGFFADAPLEEPPARVTERIPERPVPPEPPRAREPIEAPPETPRVTAEPAGPPVEAAPPAEAAPVRAAPRESLLQWIYQQGGISPNDPLISDVRSVLGGRVSNLIRKGGKPLDRLLQEAVNERFIDDPGYWGTGERTSTPRDLVDAIDRDARARAAKDETGRVWRRGEEVTERPMDERTADIERYAGDIRDKLAQQGIRGEGVDTEALYRAADSVYRREIRDPLEAYDRALAEITEREYAQQPGVRGGGEEAYPGGGAGARRRIEEAIAAPREREPGARAARKPARQEVPAQDLTHLQDVFRDKIGEGVNALDSVSLAMALKELDVGHLRGIAAAVAQFGRNRLARTAGDTPVHFITDADMRRYMPDATKPVGGLWVEAADRNGNRRAFILVNADIAADARVGTHVILHEATHAAAYNNLEKKPALKKAIRLIMDEVGKRIVNADRLYAFTNEHEFLSESFGNAPLQNALAQIPTPPSVARQLGISGKGRLGTLWDSFVETVRRLTGMPSGAKSMLETIMRVGTEATERRAQGELFGRTEAAIERERRPPPEELGVEGKPQLVIPGAEQRPAAALQRKAAAPLKSRAEQKPMDFGLFGDENRQPDLFGRRRTEMEMIGDAANEVLTDRLLIQNHPKLGKINGYLGVGANWLRVKLQDKFLHIKRIQDQWIRDNPGKALPESMDTYLAESLSHGKIDQRIREAEQKYIDPLIKAINDNGLSWDQIGEYAQAKHAPERNRELRPVNPDIPNPAGMSDAEAQAILAAARPRQAAFDASYNALRKLLDATLDMQVKDGLLSPEQAATWRQRWPDYVPMRHTEAGDMLNIGKGLEVRGKESLQAFGRLSRAENPVQFAVHQLERAIIRGEHNKVAQSFGEFVRNTPPEPTLWSITERPTIRYLDSRTGQIAEMVDPNFRNRDDVFTWKENGVQQSVWFKDKDYGAKIVRALKGLDQQRANVVQRGMGRLTRELAQLNTQRNPEFVLSNFVRDVGEAFLNLPPGFAGSFFKNLPGAIKGSWQGQAPTGGGRMATLFREFEREGGRIGFYGVTRAEQAGANIQRQLRRLQGGKINTMKDWGGKILSLLDAVNTAVENGTRLAIYAAAKENGLSPAKAASMAREGTVNFNRRGEWRGLSRYWMFANAGLQGTARLATALKTSPRARKGAAALAAGGATLAMYNIFAGGQDKDGQSKYSKIPAYVRDLNFVFMFPDGSGRYFPLPKPFGYGMFASIGEHLASYLWDNQTLGKTVSGIWHNILSGVDPLGQDKGFAHFVPTLLKPGWQLYQNQSPFGGPIRPPEQPWTKYLSKAEGYHFRTTSPFGKWSASELNKLTGGDKKTPGYLDTAPENIDYLLGFMTGGLGRFAINTWTSGTRLYQGQEWAPEKTPFLRRSYGEAPSPQVNRSIYYDEREEVRAAEQRKTPGPELQAAQAFKAATKASSNLSKQREAIQANKTLSAPEKDRRIKALDEQELNNMLQARRVLERHRARAERREPRFQHGGVVV